MYLIDYFKPDFSLKSIELDKVQNYKVQIQYKNAGCQLLIYQHPAQIQYLVSSFR